MENKLPGGLERYALFFKSWKDLDFLDDIIRARYDQMGCNTYRVHNLFNRHMVSTIEPLNIQAILATKFHDFDLGPSRHDNFQAMLGNGIFTAEGEPWAHFRKQLKPQFTRDQVSDLEAAERHLNVLFKALPEEDEKGWGSAVDIMPLIYRFTMDVSTEFLFGESVNSQSTALETSSNGKKEEEEDFAEAMNYSQEYIAWRIRLGSLYWLANSKKFQNSCKIVKSFADRFVRIALEKDVEKKRVDEGKEGKFVLLDALVAETRDPVELRDQVLQTLLAGRDTTSALLSWILLLLSRSPTEFTKLRKAVLEHFGTSTSPKQELTFSSLKSCKAITHILYETLRLYPLVPLNGRRALRDTFLPTGGGPGKDQPVVIMKGEDVGYSAYVMHRRKDIWGEDADEWKPDRWEGRKLGWEWIAFSGGPRVCLGQQYALNEASFVLVKFLQRFDGLEALDMGPIKKGLTITLSPAKGVKVKMHRASE